MTGRHALAGTLTVCLLLLAGGCASLPEGFARPESYAYTDTKVSRSLFYKKKQHEGKNKKDVVVNFSWEQNKAQYSNFNNKRPPIDILSGSFDPLSAFYYTRLVEFKKNSIIERPVTDGKKCIIGKAFVIKKERIKLASGTYDTYLIEPELKHVGGVFEKSKNAKIQLWITADKRRIPVKIKSKVVVGSFVGELVSATGIKKGKTWQKVALYPE